MRSENTVPSNYYPSLFDTILCMTGLHQMQFVRNYTTYPLDECGSPQPQFMSEWRCKFDDYTEHRRGWKP